MVFRRASSESASSTTRWRALENARPAARSCGGRRSRASTPVVPSRRDRLRLRLCRPEAFCALILASCRGRKNCPNVAAPNEAARSRCSAVHGELIRRTNQERWAALSPALEIKMLQPVLGASSTSSSSPQSPALVQPFPSGFSVRSPTKLPRRRASPIAWACRADSLKSDPVNTTTFFTSEVRGVRQRRRVIDWPSFCWTISAYRQ